MRVKKTGGKVFGVELTANEKRAMDMEIRRQLTNYNNKNLDNIDALVLWTLHTEFGFGKKRLLRFYHKFNDLFDDLSKYYEFEDDKIPWLYTQKLKEYGIDIKELNNKR